MASIPDVAAAAGEVRTASWLTLMRSKETILIRLIR